MKFKFSLEKLLRHRNIQVNLDQKKFIDKKNEYDEQSLVLSQMQELKIQVIENRRNEINTQGNWQATVAQYNEFLIGQDFRIEKQTKRLKDIEKEVEILRQILMKSLTEARMVERLKEKKKDEFLKNVQMQEQKELDEIVSLKMGTDNN